MSEDDLDINFFICAEDEEREILKQIENGIRIAQKYNLRKLAETFEKLKKEIVGVNADKPKA